MRKSLLEGLEHNYIVPAAVSITHLIGTIDIALFT